MPVLKVIKNKKYTVMCNNHLFDKNLSLKSIGLFSIILSLPDSWKYSLRGLQSLTRESYRSIKLIMRELKLNNYIEIRKKKDKEGKFIYEYWIYESKELNPNYKKPEVNLPPMVNCPLNKILNNQDKIDKTSFNEITKEILRRGYISNKNVNVVLIDNYLNNLLYRYEYNDVIKTTMYVMKHLNDNNYKDEDNKEIINITSYVITSIEDNLSIQNITFDDWFE